MGVFVLVLPFIVSYLVLNHMRLFAENFKGGLLLKMSYAFGAAVGISSALYFLELVWPSYLKNKWGGLELAVYAGVAFICLFYPRASTAKNSFPISPLVKDDADTAPSAPRWITYGFYSLSAVFILHFILISLNAPHGGWDAWFLWNVKARMMFRGGPEWLHFFTDSFKEPHADYPLLLPATIARLWDYSAGEGVLAPILVAFLFTLATLILLVASLSLFRNRLQAILAGTVLLSISFFTEHGASQFADTPLGFYLLAVITLIFLKEHIHEHKGRLAVGVLTGFFLGCAAWTKNEGILLILVVLVVYTAFVVISRRHPILRLELLPMVVGMMPLVALLLFYKLMLVPPNDIVGQSGDTIFSRLTDASRYGAIAWGYISYGLKLLKGNIVIFPIWILLFGTVKQTGYKRSFYLSVAILGFLLAGYYMVYVISPHDLSWHLRTSLKRLYLHVLPSAVWLFFMMVKTPFITGTPGPSENGSPRRLP